MDGMNLYKNFFTEKQYKKVGEQTNNFDILINENRCETFKKDGILCDHCFNKAIIDKLQLINPAEQLDFLNYQLKQYSDPIDYLRRMLALINYNEEEFESFNYRIFLEFQQLLENGIVQLTDNSQPKEKKTTSTNTHFVDPERIDELKNLTNVNFDFCKIIKYCEEINTCYTNECYLAVAMLTRAIIDHIPPIFNASNFQNVYAQYVNQSFKEQMTHLDKSLRKIADSYLHTHIRKKEILPNKTQVNFSQDIDVLLAEVCRKIK